MRQEPVHVRVIVPITTRGFRTVAMRKRLDCRGRPGSATAAHEGLRAKRIDGPPIDPIPQGVTIAAVMARLAPRKLISPMPPQRQRLGSPALPWSLAQAAE